MRRRLVLLLACTVVATSCAGDDDATDSAAPDGNHTTLLAGGVFAETTADDAKVTVVTALPTDGIADGIVSGVLVEANDCVYLDDDDFGLRVLVLPYGTRWDPATSSVVGHDGTSVSVGEHVVAQGGESPSIDDLAPWLGQDHLAEAQRCGRAAGITTAKISGTLELGSAP